MFRYREGSPSAQVLVFKGPSNINKLEGLGHVTVNKPVISIIYIVRVCLLCSAQIFVDGVNHHKFTSEIHQYPCYHTIYEYFACFSLKFKSLS